MLASLGMTIIKYNGSDRALTVLASLCYVFMGDTDSNRWTAVLTFFVADQVCS